MPSEVEVDPLWSGPVSSTMAGCERNTNNSPSVPGGQPAFLIVASPTHRFFLLALGHPALPRQAEDVGVAAEHGSMFHGGEHAFLLRALLQNYPGDSEVRRLFEASADPVMGTSPPM